MIMGLTHANRGKFLESILERTHAIYENRGMAKIQKIHVNTVMYQGKAFRKEKSTVDYIGCLSSGKFVAFDAKSHKGQSIPFSCFQLHQTDYLEYIKKFGGIAFYLVYMEGINRAWVLGIDQYKKCGVARKSIPISDLEKYGIEIDECIKKHPMMDWLNTYPLKKELWYWT